MQNPIISVKNLQAVYGQTTVLDNVSFDIMPGEVFIILGGSGCGKTTLLKHLIGLYNPKSGSIHIKDKDLVSASPEQRDEILKSFGVMYQSGALFGSMNIRDNIKLVMEEKTDIPESVMDLIADYKLSLVNLDGSQDKMPSELSGGMIKRAAIARAMALDPDIIFLDEPSAGLDPQTSCELDRIIVQLSRELGITFVIVTHELASIFRIADRVIMLSPKTKGIIATGNPKELKDNSTVPEVKNFFNA